MNLKTLSLLLTFDSSRDNYPFIRFVSFLNDITHAQDTWFVKNRS